MEQPVTGPVPSPVSSAAIAPGWTGNAFLLPASRLDDLITALRSSGRTVVGPVVANGALRMEAIERAADLPFGWTASSAPGIVRLERAQPPDRAATRAFDNGPTGSGIKAWTFPSRVDALGFETADDGTVTVRVQRPAATPIAIIGARACDLAALAVHDRVLADGPAVDPDYAARRADLFVVAVECALATSTCFCTSMGTGPEVTRGADIVLAEVDGGFVARGDSAGRRPAARWTGPGAG